MRGTGRRTTRIYPGLGKAKSIAGAEFGPAFWNAVIIFELAQMTQNWLYLLAGVFTHFVLTAMYRRDDRMSQVYRKYSRQGDRYTPWPTLSSKRNRRPEGFDSDNLC